MNRCRDPEHPHCTVWVQPGEATCAHGHAQPAQAPAAPGAPRLPSSFEAIAALRGRRAGAAGESGGGGIGGSGDGGGLAEIKRSGGIVGDSGIIGDSGAVGPAAPVPAGQLQRPQLHVSGFDPRAAGGRQAIRLSLRGMPADCAPEVRMLVRSALRLHGGQSYSFLRTSRGDWRPLFLEFSSRGLEHGQYRIEIELHSRDPRMPGAGRTWTCSPVILVPRQDASLGEIHQTFLATHKNVRVTADDAGIARVRAPGGGRVDIDVNARNASIAQLEIDAGSGKIDLGISTIAWDEDLIEIDMPAGAAPHPCPASEGCLVRAEADSATGRRVRLFARDECVLGRFETIAPEADLLLAHHGQAGIDHGGLTRRLSARHAIIRRGRHGFEIEDVSRYGLLVDGNWPGKHMPVRLRLGMRIELTASIKGIVTLEVTALMDHAVVLHRRDAGAHVECFYLMAPDCPPGTRAAPQASALPDAAALPLLFHRDGGFWQREPDGGRDIPLAPGPGRGHLAGLAARFAPRAYPEAHAAGHVGAHDGLHDGLHDAGHHPGHAAGHHPGHGAENRPGYGDSARRSHPLPAGFSA